MTSASSAAIWLKYSIFGTRRIHGSRQQIHAGQSIGGGMRLSCRSSMRVCLTWPQLRPFSSSTPKWLSTSSGSIAGLGVDGRSGDDAPSSDASVGTIA